jgi:hypothetical protein
VRRDLLDDGPEVRSLVVDDCERGDSPGVTRAERM